MNRTRVVARLNHVETAKKKAKSADAANRSAFLSMLMKLTSGDTGKTLASSAVSGNVETFRKAWDSVTKSLLLQVAENAKKTEG
jgi:hypothetical protein